MTGVINGQLTPPVDTYSIQSLARVSASASKGLMTLLPEEYMYCHKMASMHRHSRNPS